MTSSHAPLIVLVQRATRSRAGATSCQADKDQAQAPDATTALNENKGRLLQLIEDMNRVGRIAYRGQASVAARFNKDILLCARRSGSGKDEPGKTAPAPA